MSAACCTTVTNSVSSSAPPATVIKSGPGMMVLSGANTYTGTTVSAGTLIYQNTYASNSHTITGGAVLEINVASGSRNSAATSFNGTGTLRKTGAGELVWGSAAATFALGTGALIDVQIRYIRRRFECQRSLDQ